MAEYYFTKFPIITYANTAVRNISERTKILHNKMIDPSLLYPIEVSQAQRADLLANALYQDSFLEWILWLNNSIVDPYYGWFMNDDEFIAFLDDKYGSVPVAIQRISYYRTAWPSDTTKDFISVDAFNFTIPKTWRKYYQPLINDDGVIQHYYKSFLDWRSNTNQMLQWNVSMTSNAVFATGNVIQVITGGNVVGQAQVLQANSTVVTAQHTFGNTSAPNGLQDMFSPDITATFSNTKYLANNISLEEAVFWEPVSFYDYEEELNAYKRFVKVVDGNIASQVSSTMNRLLNPRV